MNPEPFNPYAPPAASPPPTRSADGWQRGGEMAVRAVAVVAGVSLVADPLIFPGVETPLVQMLGGHVLARGIGLALLAAGFLPWPGDRRQDPRTALIRQGDANSEEL